MSDEAGPVCVVGLGRIGLPLAVQFAAKGLAVRGCDIDADLVKQINDGICPYPDEEGLKEGLEAARAAGLLTASRDTTAAFSRSRTVVIIVPVGLGPDNRADFTALDKAAAAVAAGLQPGTLVVLETTVPLGTTRRRLGAALTSSGLRPGEDFFLAYSPERVFVGRVLADLRRYPKIAGGVNDASTRRAAEFYKRALDAEVMPVAACETAEMVKLAETTYRDVNIALANELAQIADEHGIDIAEVIAGANSQPFSHIHQPGAGVGGHCIPVYPRFLLEGAPVARLPRLGRETNDAMAAYAVGKLEEALGGLKGKTVLILGLSYRPDIKEAAFSSAVPLAGELAARGARALVHDPHFSAEEIAALGLSPVASLPAPCEAVIIQALHRQYRDLDFAAFPGCGVVLDGRNALDRAAVESRGMRYVGIGR